MLPKIEAEFRIMGTTVSSDEIAKAIGMAPTRTWELGETIQKTALRRKYNAWCLSSDYHRDLNLEKYVNEVLETLLPKLGIISAYCKEHNLSCELSCAIYSVDETPAVNFDEQTISNLAKLNASLDIDIILVGDL